MVVAREAQLRAGRALYAAEEQERDAETSYIAAAIEERQPRVAMAAWLGPRSRQFRTHGVPAPSS